MKRLFLGITLLSAAFLASAQNLDSLQKKAKVLQDEKIEQYRRSSLYQILVQHPDADYAPTIDSVFLMVGTPDKFNNHDLETKAITSTAKKGKKGKGEHPRNREGPEPYRRQRIYKQPCGSTGHGSQMVRERPRNR